MAVNTLGPLRILLAEDNAINKLIAKTILERWGFITVFAKDGEEAVQKVRADEVFDCILMDIQMPNKDGIEAAFEIRSMSDDSKKNTPIIALTASTQAEVKTKCFETGMNGYISKPFKEDELYAMISNVMARV